MSTNHGTPADVIKKILDKLPGGDCKGFGGCGKATCKECAEAIAAGESVALCPAAKQSKVNAIAKIMGVPAVEVTEKIAFVACSGDAAGKERFAGCKSCADAVDMGFQRGECKSGCVGVGSCMDACEFGAMKLVDGNIVIDPKKCNGCGACANAQVCPQHVVLMIPADATNFIPCSSKEEDEDKVREICGYGCIGCGDCERACPESSLWTRSRWGGG
ncbi:4Fe-4S dicluster domain-containing protein [Aminicella lysinilytica]|uniref:4Fe-4S dicluster domain-containing protein n=1 Tax=Aminicella lysinilytica TaxID=433323 RepID=UPI0026ED959F|nr:(Fe-S)-binding protein [Aminicella lysinilytica]